MGSTAAPAVVGRALEANIGRAQAPHNTIVSVTVITDTTTDPIVSAINPADTTTLFTDTVTDPTDTVTLLIVTTTDPIVSVINPTDTVPLLTDKVIDPSDTMTVPIVSVVKFSHFRAKFS